MAVVADENDFGFLKRPRTMKPIEKSPEKTLLSPEGDKLIQRKIYQARKLRKTIR